MQYIVIGLWIAFLVICTLTPLMVELLGGGRRNER